MVCAPGGIVEIGAGLGYWAHQLSSRGVDVVAYDIAPKKNHWCDGEPWFPVRVGSPEDAALHRDLKLPTAIGRESWAAHREFLKAAKD